MDTAPSPTPIGALSGILAFLFPPALAFIWMGKCSERQHYHSATFALLAVLGFASFLIAASEFTCIFVRDAGRPWIIVVATVSYCAIGYYTAILVGRVFPEIKDR